MHQCHVIAGNGIRRNLIDARQARIERNIAQVNRVLEAQVASHNWSKRKGNTSSDCGGAPGRARKDRDPNWNKVEILDMVDCKDAKHLEELDIEDSHDIMQPETSKWTHIASKVNVAGNRAYHRHGATYKYKWQTLLSYYKKIADFHSGIRMNGRSIGALPLLRGSHLDCLGHSLRRCMAVCTVG